MKKIFLLFMILGLSFMSFVDTQAFTHTTFYGYDLDTSLQELGNQSLREFFYDNNMNYQLYDLTSTGVSVINNYIYFETSQYDVPYIYLSDGTTRFYFNSSRLYYITYSIDITNDSDLDNFNVRNRSYSKLFDSGVKSFLNTISSTSLYIQLVAFQTGNTTATFNANDFYIIDITATGLQLSKDRLDFLFHVYKTLYDRELAYDDGYDSGYDDGNLDGYGTGFTDGTTYGQNEYHTGNYGTLDETQGIPYNDGYNAGVAEELDTNYLLSFVQGSLAVLGAPILPNITLGVFVFIPLFFGFIAFLFRLGGKRG